GDLYLLGRPLKARIVCERCGHNHNVNFLKELSKAAPAATQNDTNKSPEDSKMDPAPTANGIMLDINAIQNTIPHRYPFLMIDRVIITEELKKATGFKCVSGNEGFFQGHFPGAPIMPGVLIVEAMAQTSCVLFLSRPDLKGKLAYFMSIDGVKFRKPVIPGDLLELRVEVIRAREKGGKIRGKAYVDDVLVTEAEFLFAIVDKEGGE
ncbi:MAG: 3-hydroxyacyl-ACP dehydratase FabZ, partial [Endomicrobiales bacterium]